MPTPARLEVPTVDTARLVLRGHGLDDLADSAALWGDPAVTRYIGGRPSTEEEVWSRLLRYAGHWAALGYGYWVVVERASGRFVGEVGLADFRRAIEPSLAGAPEAGWVLAPWAHGRGYATEAVRAALAWYEDRFGPTRTVCIVDPAHAASLRVAARCGFRELARTTYHGDPTVVLERPPGGAPAGG
jgi:RimJ/RimL family protein N-acetyltransferase